MVCSMAEQRLPRFCRPCFAQHRGRRCHSSGFGKCLNLPSPMLGQTEALTFNSLILSVALNPIHENACRATRRARSGRPVWPVGRFLFGASVLLATAVLAPLAAFGQEGVQNMMALDGAGSAPRTNGLENYTFKKGDFRLLATPSLGLDWNDNVRTSEQNKESDFILRPMLQRCNLPADSGQLADREFGKWVMTNIWIR